MTRTLVLILAALLLGGCSLFDESFHFTARTPGSPFTQYYRVDIEGFGFLASSEYAAGMYDAEAVDALFGELEGGTIRLSKGQAKDERDGEGSGEVGEPAEPSAQEPRSLDGESLAGKRLVLFLSSKADGLISRIKAFTSGKNVTANLTALLLKEDIATAERARAEQAGKDARAETFAEILEQSAERLSNVDAQEVDLLAPTLRSRALETLQALARQIEPGVELSDLSAAQAWYAEHHASLREALR